MAPSVKTTVTHVVRSHSADQAPQSPVGLGFLVKYGRPKQGASRQTPEPASNSIMSLRIERLDRILGCFNSALPESIDEQHLAFSSLPTTVLIMAQELVTVQNQLKSEVQIVGREPARIDRDDQVQLLDIESQKVQESLAAQVAE